MDISDQKKIVQILLLLFVYIFKHCLLMFSRKQRFFSSIGGMGVMLCVPQCLQ